MLQKLRLPIMILLASFSVLFLGNLVFSLTKNDEASAVLGSFEGSRKNYATSKGVQVQAGQVAGGDKYEKVARIGLNSYDFTNDEKKLRETVGKFNALIQNEDLNAFGSRRTLQVSIGVTPDQFDGFVASIKEIGNLTHFSVQKSDKTNEYRELQAQKVSLEKTVASLQGLKARGGRVDELLGVENRLLELEEQIQKLAVRLGEFNAENEFCTVQLTLTEKGNATSAILGQVFDSAIWALAAIVVIGIILSFVSLGLLVIYMGLQKLPLILTEVKKYTDKPPQPPKV